MDNAWYQLIWSVFSLQLITRVMFRSCPAKSPWNLGQFRPVSAMSSFLRSSFLVRSQQIHWRASVLWHFLGKTGSTWIGFLGVILRRKIGENWVRLWDSENQGFWSRLDAEMLPFEAMSRCFWPRIRMGHCLRNWHPNMCICKQLKVPNAAITKKQKTPFWYY